VSDASRAPSARAGRQFLRYAGAGAIGTATHYALLVVLVQLAGVAAVVASTAGAIAGAVVNYLLNHRYTFASDKPHSRALPRFVVVSLAGIAVNAAVVATLVSGASAHYLLAQVVATAVVLVLGFAINRIWTF
jgi:putative flippase GtrA